MGEISRDTYKRIYLLAIVNAFPDGIYGRMRMQKTVYESLKNSETKVFSYFCYDFGQFSTELCDTQDQLLSMNFLSAQPIASKHNKQGNRINYGHLINKDKIKGLIDKVLGDAVIGGINEAVKKVGFLTEEVLLQKMHEELDQAGIRKYDLLFNENLSEEIEIDLDDSICEGIELMFNPEFASAMRNIDNAISNVKFDFSKVKRVIKIDGSI